MSLEVKIEIRSIVKKMANQPADGDTHNFIVSVQGLIGNCIEHFVKEVVFYWPLNSNSKQVRTKPPYLISGSTRASFRLPIYLFLHTSQSFRKVKYSYFVFVPDNKPEERAVCVKTLTFLNSPQDFRERLLLGGAEPVSHQKKSRTDVTGSKCKSEPVETIENQEVADSNNILIHLEKSDEQAICTAKHTEDVNNKQNNHSQLPNTCVQSQDNLKQSDSFTIQGIYSFDELLKENEILKKENETLNKQLSNQGSIIATYAERIPVLQNSFSALDTELNEIRPKAEANEAQISILKSSVEILMAKVLQHKNKINEVKVRTKKPQTPAVLVWGK